jgi:hypothetical protein
MNDANTESCWGRTVSRRRQPILTEQPDYRAITPFRKSRGLLPGDSMALLCLPKASPKPILKHSSDG